MHVFPCRACGFQPFTSQFKAPSDVGTILRTRIECLNHPYVSVTIEAESVSEARQVWNQIHTPSA
jgi:hypothetical protein